MWRAEFEVFNHRNGSLYSYRPFCMERDFDLYCRWMQQPYVARWWNLNKPRSELEKHLQSELADPHQKLYTSFVDDVPVGYWERYWVERDVLGRYVQACPYDQGFHFLIGEKAYLGRTYTASLIAGFVKMIFQDSRTQRVLAEPDVRNRLVLRYAAATCFELDKVVQMPERTSAVMVCERHRFFSSFSASPGRLWAPGQDEVSFQL